jgi:hypothetical protein
VKQKNKLKRIRKAKKFELRTESILTVHIYKDSILISRYGALGNFQRQISLDESQASFLFETLKRCLKKLKGKK